jgi:hypothetical protein
MMTFKAYKLYSFIIISFVFLASCEKDKQINSNAYCASCEPCAKIPPNISSQPRQIIESSFQRLAPFFNPINGNEFVYLKQDSLYNTSLVKYNLITKNETIILTGQRIVCQPKWGKNGWVVFAALNLQIYKVKQSGDSLTQLTNLYMNSYPDITSDGKIMSNITGGESYRPCLVFLDFNGKRLDSVKFSTINNNFLNPAVINYNNEIAASNQSNIVLFNRNNNLLELLTNDTGTNQRYLSSVCWHSNGNDIYYSSWVMGDNNSDFAGICRLNKNSKENVCIKNSCNSRSYSSLSISPDGKKIIAERQDYQLMPDNNLLKKSDICIMDIDGRNEEKVFK